MTKNVCYIEWDPSKVKLGEPFRKAIQLAVQEEREGYIRVQRTAENVKAAAEKYGQSDVKITSGAVLSHNR